MLKLPNDWNQIHGGALADELLAQIEDPPRRDIFSKRLIRSSLDVAIRTYWGRNGRKIWIRESHGSRWQLGCLTYVYLAPLDDRALYLVSESPRQFSRSILIVPGDCDRLFHHALQDLMKDKTPTVFSFTSFLSWRTMFAGADARWPRERVIKELLSTYNDCVRGAGDDERLLAQLPQWSKA